MQYLTTNKWRSLRDRDGPLISLWLLGKVKGLVSAGGSNGSPTDLQNWMQCCRQRSQAVAIITTLPVLPKWIMMICSLHERKISPKIMVGLTNIFCFLLLWSQVNRRTMCLFFITLCWLSSLNWLVALWCLMWLCCSFEGIHSTYKLDYNPLTYQPFDLFGWWLDRWWLFASNFSWER